MRPAISPSPKYILASILAVMTCAPAAALAADTRLGLDAELVHDTNVNRAAYASEEQADDILALEGYAARSFRLSYRSGIVLRGGLRLREHREFGDLSNFAALGRVAYRFQPTPGYTSPWIELAGAVEALRFEDSELRDGYIASASASAGKYLTDRIRVGAGLGLDQRVAEEGALYDLSTNRGWLTLDYRVTSKATLYGSATWISGDHVFTANNPATRAQLSRYSDVIVGDPAFADAFGGVAVTAYRVEATTYLFEAGVNIPITGSQALDFGVSYFDSAADQGDGEYDGSTFRLSYLYRFR